MLREIEYTESKNQETSDAPRKRSMILAFVLSYFVVGWGQAYNGQYIKGIAFISINLFVVVLFAFEIAPPDRWGILAFIFRQAVPLFSAIDAALNVKNPSDERLTIRKKILIYIFFFIFAELICWLPVPQNPYFFNPFLRWQKINVYDSAMEPTVMKYSNVIIDTIYYDKNHINRGDIVVFADPIDINENRFGRVIAFAGENVKSKNKKIFINNIFFEDSIYDRTHCQIMKDIDYGIIPEDSVFVYGDVCISKINDNFSWYVPLSGIKGKVIKINN